LAPLLLLLLLLLLPTAEDADGTSTR